MEVSKEDARAEPVGIAVLGCGYWGANYVRIFNELAEARVVVACDQRVDRLHEVGRRYHGVKLTTDLEDALQTAGVEAVIVCTPATSHHLVGRQCLLAGKHVLIEKPLATSAVEANDLIALADSKERILMVGHTFLYNPALRKVKDYIDRAEAGRIYYLYARRTNLGPIRHEVNALWDLAPHDIAIFNYLLDRTPAWVSAVGARVLRNGREDVGFVALGYPDGIIGHIHVSWADPHKVREVVVVGSDKRIVFNDLLIMEQVRVYERGVALADDGAGEPGQHPFRIRDGAIISPPIQVSEPLKNQCRHFLDCVTQGLRPLTSGAEGRAVVRVLEAIDRSLARQGAPVPVAQEERYDYHECEVASTLH